MDGAGALEPLGAGGSDGRWAGSDGGDAAVQRAERAPQFASRFSSGAAPRHRPVRNCLQRRLQVSMSACLKAFSPRSASRGHALVVAASRNNPGNGVLWGIRKAVNQRRNRNRSAPGSLESEESEDESLPPANQTNRGSAMTLTSLDGPKRKATAGGHGEGAYGGEESDYGCEGPAASLRALHALRCAARAAAAATPCRRLPTAPRGPRVPRRRRSAPAAASGTGQRPLHGAPLRNRPDLRKPTRAAGNLSPDPSPNNTPLPVTINCNNTLTHSHRRESIIDIARSRTGWLVAFCIGLLLAALVVEQYEDVLQQHVEVRV